MKSYRNYYHNYQKNQPSKKRRYANKQRSHKAGKFKKSNFFSSFFSFFTILFKQPSSFFNLLKRSKEGHLLQNHLVKYYLIFFFFLATIPLLYTSNPTSESLLLQWVNKLEITKPQNASQDTLQWGNQEEPMLEILKIPEDSENAEVLVIPGKELEENTPTENAIAENNPLFDLFQTNESADDPSFIESSEFQNTLIPLNSIGDLENDGLSSTKQENPYLRENLKEKAFQFKPYRIKNGDSLWSIARQYNITVDSLISLNSLQNPERLKNNQQIKIPQMSGVYHQVRKNESLYSIAKTYNVSVDTIKEYNQVGGFLKIGQTLFLKQAHLSENSRNLLFGHFFIKPTSGKLSSKYGMRTHPISRKRIFHTGIDIVANAYTKVRASAAGTIVKAQPFGSYGNYIEIKHANGYTTAYAHLKRIWGKKGQGVKQGQFIGMVGNTGRSTGTHLHFEIKHKEKYINPSRFVKYSPR